MRLLNYITISLVAILSLSGCSSYDESPVNPDDGGPGTYLRLKMYVAPGSRSNPEAGETGDGLEDGTAAENRIDNLTIFIYNSRYGLDAPEDTRVNYSVYIPSVEVNQSDVTVSCLIKLQNYTPTTDDHIIVLANMGNQTRLETLGKIAAFKDFAAWTAASMPAACSSFAMATARNTADDGVIKFRDNMGILPGTQEQPLYAETSIERVAARIDLWFDDANIDADGNFIYPVYTSTGSRQTATVHIDKVIPVNAMQLSPWALKHLTNSVSDDMSCFNDLNLCGDELVGNDRLPVNYVVEPTTVLKTASMTIPPASWYGNTGAAVLRADITGALDAAPAVSAYKSTHRPSPDADHQRFFTLTYVNENTQHLSAHDSRFITGLLYRAVYEPQTVYTDAEASAVASTYRRGDTFWCYRPSRHEMLEDNVLYFASESAARSYASAHPGDQATVTEYPGAICYYNLWLRHANNDKSNPHRTCPMEYGVVRNNIYRVSVTFSGAGQPRPLIDEPMNIRYRIFVRKWNFRPQPEIIM